MLYLDTNIFVNAAINEDETGNRARFIISQATRGKVKAITSVITWDEVFWAIKKRLERQTAAKQSAKLLQLAGIEIVPLNADILKTAQNLVENYNLDPRDSIHAATAITHGCDYLVSIDSDFKDIKEIKWKKL